MLMQDMQSRGMGPGHRLTAHWPLTGRAEEITFVSESLRMRGAHAVVLSGAAGVGKTRLAREALLAAESAGYDSAWVTATEAAATIPFGALAPLINESEAQGESNAVLLRSFARAMVHRAEGRRLALVVDDAHLLDD